MTNSALLIGGDLCQRTARLLPAAWRCTGLRRHPPTDEGSHLRWIVADVGDPGRLAVILAAEPAITHILYAPAPAGRNADDYARIYPGGLQTLLATLPDPQKLQRCVLVDSTAVWRASEAWVDEDTAPNPEDFRGRLMLDAEAILHESLPSPRFPHASGVALRLSGLYGPERLQLIDGLRAGRIPAPDGVGHWANRIHADDAARACAHLLTLDRPLPCYIGTDDHPMPTADLYDALANIVGGPRPARHLRPASGKRLSNRRLRASGWRPQWADMVTGYADCLQHPQKLTR